MAAGYGPENGVSRKIRADETSSQPPKVLTCPCRRLQFGKKGGIFLWTEIRTDSKLANLTWGHFWSPT